MFDDLQAQLAANRSEFYRALPSDPFYDFDKPGVESSEAVIENCWRQGMLGDALSHYDGIVAFSQTDFTADPKKITIPTLVMHGTDDQIVPCVASGPKSTQLLQNGTLKTNEGLPHGIPTTHADVVNADLWRSSERDRSGVGGSARRPRFREPLMKLRSNVVRRVGAALSLITRDQRPARHDSGDTGQPDPLPYAPHRPSLPS